MSCYESLKLMVPLKPLRSQSDDTEPLYSLIFKERILQEAVVTWMAQPVL